MSVDRWLSRLRPNTAEKSWYMFRAWMGWLGRQDSEFSGFDADGLVAFQRGAVGEDRFAILDLLQRYLIERGGRAGYKQRIYGCVRGFFLHNRAELPRDRSFKIRSEKAPVVGDLRLEAFKNVLLSCNKMYRAIYLCMFQAGLGIGELLHWSENGLESVREQLMGNVNPLRIDLPGRKIYRNLRPYYTFIGYDGIRALRDWLAVRPDVDYPDIFITQFGSPVKYKTVYAYWMWKLRRLGIIGKKGPDKGNRYGKNPHEIRDLFRTRWQKSGRVGEVAEFMMGHTVDPLGYNKAMRDENFVRGEYRRASKWLNILSEDPEHVHVDEVDRLREAQERAMREIVRRLEMLEREK